VPDISDFWPFVVAFAGLIAAGIGVPIPEELPTIGAGIWVATNPGLGPARWLILPVCYLGVLVSDVILYGIGRFWGPKLLRHRYVERWLSPETRQRTEQNFRNYGLKILLFIRWLPGIRSPMFITAGIMRLPLVLFVLADGIAAVFGHSVLFFLAWWFGDQFRELVVRAENTFAASIKPLIILTLIVGVVVYFLIRFLKKPVVTADPKELPLIGDKVANTLSHSDLHIPFLSKESAHPQAGQPNNQEKAPAQPSSTQK
jgi:membrane protein DedA with SNARE-associated domain